VVVTVEGFSLVVVVVKSALVVVDILVDRGTVELLSAIQCSQIKHSDETRSLNCLVSVQHCCQSHQYVLDFNGITQNLSINF